MFLLGSVIQGFLLLGDHEDNMVHPPVAVAKFVVMQEGAWQVAIEGSVSSSIESRRADVII